MFELKTKGSDGWKAIIGLSWSLNEEAVINVTKDGLDFKVMDIDRSGLVDFEWKKENMINFKCDSEQKIGFRTEDFNKILKRASSSDDIKLSHTGQGIMTIDIGQNKSYDLRLVETNLIETGSKPKISFTNTFTVPYDVLKEKVDDMLIIGHFMKITVNNGEILFSVNGEGKKGNTIFRDESIKVSKEIAGDFSLSHLDNALKSVKTKEVELSLEGVFPLCLKLVLENVGEIKYYLAPYTGGTQ